MDVLGVLDRRLGPGPEAVRTVEVPVTEAPDDLGGKRGPAGRLHRLGVLEDIDAVGRLDLEADRPPEGHQGREQAGLPGDAPDAPPGRLLRDEYGVEEEEHGRDAGVEDRARVDAADQRDHQREQRRVPPARAPDGEDHERDHPREPRPRHEDHRDASRVLQHVGGVHVAESADVATRSDETDHAAEVERAGTRTEEERAHPEALRDPERDVQLRHDPEVGAHRKEVADVLVGDRPEPDARIPEGRRLPDIPARVEVEVRLGVVGDRARLRCQHRDEGHQREREVVDHRAEPTGEAQPVPERARASGERSRGRKRRRDRGGVRFLHECSVV